MKPFSAVAIGAALTLFGASALFAQMPAEREIAVGSTARGVIASTSPRLVEGARYDAWRILANPGQWVQVTLRSDDFDAFLVVARGPASVRDHVAYDDDGAGGTDSRIAFRMETGEYWVLATTLSEGEVGAYALSVEEIAPATDTPLRVALAATTAGQLGGGTPAVRFVDYVFDAPPQQSVRATIRATGFSPQLWIGGMVDGIFQPVWGRSAEQAGDTASLSVPPGDGGPYVVRVSAIGDAAGTFSLTIAAPPAPPAADPAQLPVLRPNRATSGTLDERSGLLEDGTHYTDYRHTARAGERVLIDLQSDDFDAYLLIGRSVDGVFVPLAGNDDNHDGGLDATIVYTFQETGDYIIRVNTATPGTGTFTLTLRRL